jgi:hypothetical protein
MDGPNGAILPTAGWVKPFTNIHATFRAAEAMAEASCHLIINYLVVR